MKNNLLLLFVFFKISSLAQDQPPVGNWLQTDGSNQFTLGLYGKIACYAGETWTITRSVNTAGHWQVDCKKDAASIHLDLTTPHPHTLLLTVNGTRQTLADHPTYRATYKPAPITFRQPLFREGIATVRGYLHRQPGSKDTKLSATYIQVSYTNSFTGETEYVPADLSEDGRFSIRFPVTKGQLCSLLYQQQPLTTFLVRPGSTLLLVVNKDLPPAPGDDAQIVQKVSTMGDDEHFNRLYQQFLALPAITDTTVKSYEAALSAINTRFPPSTTDSKFVDYIKAELGNNFAYSILFQSSAQSIGPGQLALCRQFLEPASEEALLHDSYYRLVAWYADFYTDSRKFDSHYPVAPEKRKYRIEHELGPLLPASYTTALARILQDRKAYYELKEEERIRTYFGGSRPAFDAFNQLSAKISDQLQRECADSATYEYYTHTFKNPALLFAAELAQLLYRNEREGIPSEYQLRVFRHFSDSTLPPARIINRLIMDNATQQVRLSLRNRADTGLITQVDNESQWQTLLKTYRGKTVVAWAFSHNFKKEYVAPSLHEMQKMQRLYQGKNVVFLKCLVQRDHSDREVHLLNYLRLFDQAGTMDHIVYINQQLSPIEQTNQSVNYCTAIYNAAGEPTHPPLPIVKEDRGGSLPAEIDRVLSGQGLSALYKADSIFAKREAPPYGLPVPKTYMRTWTLRDSSGSLRTYTPGQPEKPAFPGDTVFQLINFVNDSAFVDQTMTFHASPRATTGAPLTYPTFSLHRNGEIYSFHYSGKDRLIRIFDGQNRLCKQYQVNYVDRSKLMLEIIPIDPPR